MSDKHIPVIDFESCNLTKDECSHDDLTKVGKQLVEGFSGIGFVYLKNYGITDSDVQDMHKLTEKFFLNPMEEKSRYCMKGGNNFGWIPNKTENATFNPNMPCDYKEAFNINSESFQREKSAWPDDIAPGFSHGVMEFMERARKLSLRILHALAIGMGLKDEYFFHKYHNKMHTKENNSTLKTAYYLPITEPLLPGQVRCGEHADTSSVTLVFQDSVGGLQARASDGTYVDATPIKETVVVNVGDVLDFWTKGKLKSSKHRVIVKEGEEMDKKLRRSLIYFAICDNDVYVDKPLEYKDENLNERGEPDRQYLTTEDWLAKKLKQLWPDEKK